MLQHCAASTMNKQRISFHKWPYNSKTSVIKESIVDVLPFYLRNSEEVFSYFPSQMNEL